MDVEASNPTEASGRSTSSSTETDSTSIDDGSDAVSVVEEIQQETPPPTLYVPAFLAKYDIPNNMNKTTRDAISKLDWLPSELKKEVADCCYKSTGQQRTSDNARCQEAFVAACKKLFPNGRVFASHKQLDQAAKMFLSSWGVKLTHGGQQIRCFYASPANKKSRRSTDPTKRRRIGTSPKITVQCPFVINYSVIAEGKIISKVFHQVKITSSCFQHTCNPSTVSHRVAIEKSGQAMPSLAGLQAVVLLLRNKPTLSAGALRPLLKHHIPWFKPGDAKFIANFRRKALKFNMENAYDATLTHSDKLQLTDNNSAAEECTIEDSPLSRENLQEVLRTVMQEGPDIWHALSLLKKYKKITPGLDYCIRYNKKNHKPEAVCWMLPEMKADAIRYSRVLFLDAQKRDMNRPGWPYIAPCVKDSENKVRAIAECLCISESFENYAWVLKSMEKMESNFGLKNIKIIFADQFLNESFLDDVGIADTCILHGDYYHSLNKVFPEKFGNKFESIRKYLKAMLSGDEVGWEAAYKQAKATLAGDPAKASILDQIKRRPTYYSSWWIRGIEGNLFCKGSVPSEINHSSVVAHLGLGGTLSLEEHITKLFQRQIFLNTGRRQFDNRQRPYRRHPSTRRVGQTGMNDIQARKALSTHAYVKIYLAETNNELQFVAAENGGFEFWSPATSYEERRDCSDHFFWDESFHRCPCHRRVCLGIQCRHELSKNNIFCKKKWDSRWLNDETYRTDFTIGGLSHSEVTREPQCVGEESEDSEDTLVGVSVPPEVAHQLVVPTPNTGLQPSQIAEAEEGIPGDLDGEHNAFVAANIRTGEWEVGIQGDLDGDNEAFSSANHYTYNQNNLNHKPAAVESPSYQALSEKMEELVRLVNKDRVLSESLNKTLQTMIERVRDHQSIDVYFVQTTRIESPTVMDVEIARVAQAPNAGAVKRYKSRHEISSGHRKKSRRLCSPNDPDYVKENIKTKTCRFCRGSGHTMNHCPKIDRYSGIIAKTKEERGALATNLERAGYYPVVESPNDDRRVVAMSFPKGVKGIVVHAKRKCPKVGVYFEITLLCDNGDPHPDYTRYPFSYSPLREYIIKAGVVSAIICEMMPSEVAPAHPNIDQKSQVAETYLPPGLSQLSQISLPNQYVDLSQSSLPQLPHGDMYVYPPSTENENYMDKIGFGGGVGDM